MDNTLNGRRQAWPYAKPTLANAGFATSHRLNEVYASAQRKQIDHSSKIIFFSDSHRGVGGPGDVFKKNKTLFLQALNHYYENGFTYIEVGDGDELWQNSQFNEIRQANSQVFDLLHDFNQDNRLFIIFGNHDLQKSPREQVEKDGLLAHEGLILEVGNKGSTIFIVHGHQVDFTSDRLAIPSRLTVRYFGLPMLRLAERFDNLCKVLEQKGSLGKRFVAWQNRRKFKLQRRLFKWVQQRGQFTIFGHTHLPAFARGGDWPYFNTGACLFPGYITGVEIQNGLIAPVKWVGQSNGSGRNRSLAERQLMANPVPLEAFLRR